MADLLQPIQNNSQGRSSQQHWSNSTQCYVLSSLVTFANFYMWKLLRRDVEVQHQCIRFMFETRPRPSQIFSRPRPSKNVSRRRFQDRLHPWWFITLIMYHIDHADCQQLSH